MTVCDVVITGSPAVVEMPILQSDNYLHRMFTKSE